ncbi:MAG: thioredoxin domain-containing protein [Candidatus Woesearchaeota archaeon]
MICLLALIVFSILGIFSATHRKLAAKAFDCVFRRITLRPCQSGLDQKVKTDIIVFFSKRNTKIAKFVAKNFEILSWIFTILMIASIVFSVRGIYFYIIYGNCNGQNSNEFCIFDAIHPNEATCEDPNIKKQEIKFIPKENKNDIILGNPLAKLIIIEYGCYSCSYTKKAQPIVNEILKNYGTKIKFIYRDFPIKEHETSLLRSNAAKCAASLGKFLEYHNLLFENQEKNLTIDDLKTLAKNIKLNQSFDTCLEQRTYENEINQTYEEARANGLYGTPTFFINDKIVVGNKPYAYFKEIIDKELSKTN